MNLVGKIFVVSILVMSVLFMAFAMAVYATHQNWRERSSTRRRRRTSRWGWPPQLKNCRTPTRN